MVTDKTRREAFITQNLGLVHACAGRFRGRGMEYDDLYSAGCVGLIKAYDNFDESRGVCFSTYAVPMNVPCGNPPIHHKRTAKTIYKGENYAILQH